MSSSWLSLRNSAIFFSSVLAFFVSVLLPFADVVREMEKVKFENIIYSGSFLLKFIV